MFIAVHVCLLLTVFFPFLMKPLVKLGEVFPRRPLNFFMSVVDKSVKERQVAADDEEVSVVVQTALMFYGNVSVFVLDGSCVRNTEVSY